MYLPQHFEETRPEVLHALLRAHPLGLVVHMGDDGAPVANPVPFMLEPAPAGADGGAPSGPGRLIAHVARANPLWRQAAGQNVLVVFQGADGYVSPGWYPSKAETGKVVPTWNYAMVQARGTLRALDDAAAARVLVSRLTAEHEAGRPRPWGLGDAPADYIAAMLKGIVVIEVELVSLVGKYKLSQNRSAADRGGVLHGLAELAAGSDAAPARQADALAQAMTEHGGPAAC
jgi:transcriptional regulator